MTYDNFHEKKDNIFRVLRVDKNPDGSVRRLRGGLSMPVGPALVSEIAAVENSVRFLAIRTWVKAGNFIQNESLLFTDPAFFDIFSFNLIKASTDNPLKDINSVVLTEREAEKIFGSKDVVGKTLAIKTEEIFSDFIVTGVVENVPENSSIRFDILLNYYVIEHSSRYRESADNWRNYNSSIFVLLDRNVEKSGAEPAIDSFAETHWEKSPGLRLQKLIDVHLDNNVGANIEIVSNPANSYILTAIGIFILFIACINYITMSISRSSSRFKEVGMRKVLGANRKNLIMQFWGEALFLCFFSTLCGLLFAKLMLPAFNSFAEKSLELNLFGNWSILAAAVGLMLFTGGMAGSYPAILMARGKTVEIFQGKYKIKGKENLGRGLLIVQFAISIILIISTLSMTKQLNYMLTKDLGFNEDQVVEIPVYETPDSEKVLAYFKNTLAGYPQILNISGTSGGFTRFRSRSYITDGAKRILFYHYKIDENYLDTLQINIKEGRNFTPEFKSDAGTSVLINEKLKRELGWDSALGKTLPGQKNSVVVGVVNDFHNISLHSEIPAVVLYLDPSENSNFILVKLNKNDIASGLEVLEKTWTQYVSNVPFVFNFLDDEIDLQYKSTRKWGHIVRYSSTVALFLACMGLLGLISLTITKRVKEIGIRKVLGASVLGIVALLSRDFSKWVLIANIIAWPTAYFIVNKWLQNFAYRININVWLFIFAAMLTLFVAMITIGFQSIRAALANPVESLKYE